MKLPRIADFQQLPFEEVLSRLICEGYEQYLAKQARPGQAGKTEA